MSKPLPPLQVPFTIPQYISYFPYTSNVVLNQLLEQFNHEFHQMIEICETENSLETWNVLHAYFLHKIDVINHHLAIVSNDPNDDSLDLFDENISPRTTARKIEQIKKVSGRGFLLSHVRIKFCRRYKVNHFLYRGNLNCVLMRRLSSLPRL